MRLERSDIGILLLLLSVILAFFALWVIRDAAGQLILTQEDLKMGEKRLKVFFDSEFTGLHQRTTLVSIGLVAESGETFYAEFNNWDREALKDKWFRENVAAHLLYSDTFQVRGFPGGVWIMNNPQHIKANLGQWFKVLLDRHNAANIEFWSDCLAYDWVLFCELWGGALKVPDEIYYIPFDLCTLLWIIGEDPDVNREAFAGLSASEADKHNVLWDARVIRACCEKLMVRQTQKMAEMSGLRRTGAAEIGDDRTRAQMIAQGQAEAERIGKGRTGPAKELNDLT